MRPHENLINKTGCTVTFIWICEDTNKHIEKGELFSHIGGDNSLLFKVNPNTNILSAFDNKTRIDITLAVPLSLSTVSVKMVLNDITTDDTGYYSFKVFSVISDDMAKTSNVSLYVTGN